ncbi:MAG TPA: hypothetical protein VE010_08555 [Thermoanaerobaculia bacterium]|nr:hypothetical protein [Thermoanaerobaculia bacterium]
MSNRNLMGRRQFLTVSSVAALATVALGPKLFASEAAASSPRRLAVGYSAFGADYGVVDAAAIPAADGGFVSRGARIMASGALGAPGADARSRRAVQLFTHFSYMDGAERRSTPFNVWSSSRLTRAQGSAVAFTVPVDEVQKISLTMATETGAPAAVTSRGAAVNGEQTVRTELPLTLSLQNEEATHKLARGYYVIVPLLENEAQPHWRDWSVGKAGERTTLVDRDGVAAPFEHFVLHIDYATAE